MLIDKKFQKKLEKAQIKLVEEFSFSFTYMNNPSEKVKKYFLENFGRKLRWLPEENLE